MSKTAIAYGIAELLRQAARSYHNSGIPLASFDARCSIDNFAVRTKSPGRRSHPTWRDIDGVDMLSPRLSVNIVEPAFLQEENDGDQYDELGRYLEVEFPTLPETDGDAVFVGQSEENVRCHSFGVLLYELFLNSAPISAGEEPDDGVVSESASKNADASLEWTGKMIQLVDLRGCSNLSGGELPSSLLLVIQSLLDCGEDDRTDHAYDSLDAVISDLHLLLLDPSRFLFHHEPVYDDNGRMKLSFREHQLYGREHEVSLITEAFCRVSGGKSESLFIGGFSGSGKSRLVNALTARVDAVGGYVLTHKFDQMSQEKSMLDVIAIFNNLCLLIKEKSPQLDLLVLVSDLFQVFGSDWSTLARLLPNIKVIVPHLERSADDIEVIDNQMNVRSICFTLQRFLRVVSSATHPVMLFLDDLQWCGKEVLTVVESLLCDTIGPPCVFFVGTYRSNEVADDHEIFCLEKRLKSSGIPLTMLSLEGLNPSYLNTMVSDALCIFPRITEPLSDIIYQKTRGNPFFVLAFMRSLVDRGLLEYNFSTRRWIWDDDDVSKMDITENVLHLLLSKMSGMSPSIQSALKIAACFGMKIEEAFVKTLCADPEHSDIRDWLEQVVKEGFMVKCGTSEFKFVHDKYHYSIGLSLYSSTKGKVADDILFSIADQIKLGIGNLATESPALRIDIAKLYGLAGMRAAASLDHVASRSYLEHALSLLPTDHWKSNYEISLRYSHRLAESCYSCGDVEKAQCILQEMTSQCHSTDDKLPAHSLLARILLDRKSFMEAYTLCHEVLSQLGEDIPSSLEMHQIDEMVEATLQVVERISSRDLLNMKEADESLGISMHFFNIMASAAYMLVDEKLHFVVCRMIQLTMKNGLCKYSNLGFIQFAALLCNRKTAKKKGIAIASQIGKAAMSCCRERYHASDMVPQCQLVYYSIVASHTEPLNACAGMLQQGFDAGMSSGDVGTAFLNASISIMTAVLAGDRLPTLLERVDYYLKLTNTYQQETSKVFLSIFRSTISILIDKGESTNSSLHVIDVPIDTTNTSVLESILYFQRSIQAYWQGHNERCQYYIDMFLSVCCDVWRHQFIMFLNGLNSFHLMREKSSKHLRAITKRAIRVVKTAASRSIWNFNNKIHLLEAEQFSFENNNSEAHTSYAAAISSACSSGFVHEQGLACELAGYHYKKVGDFRSALCFFGQAKRCYTEWGSQMKLDNVTHQFDSLADRVTDDPL
ncbi:hypothetical protein ACHAXA_006682 [Cyclostephanos tholiformis]|uniref:Orc1-like AAA ATPase domain-containing protein n=1 Tax=Cyclostephanos tholiformis TaxID=382380 RepID=A0ABD3R4D1_9STRA